MIHTKSGLPVKFSFWFHIVLFIWIEIKLPKSFLSKANHNQSKHTLYKSSARSFVVFKYNRIKSQYAEKQIAPSIYVSNEFGI